MCDLPKVKGDAFQCHVDYFTNSENLKLYEQIWTQANNISIRAMVFIIHGLNEHSSFCYEDTVVKPLIQIGCMVVSHDHVGHGRSDGDRQMVGKVENLARDVLEHIDDLRRRKLIQESTPIFLYGHSLGGLIACMISLDNPEIISGMVLEAPALSLSDTAASSWMKFMAARVLALVVPSWVIRKPLFINLSRNMSVVQAARDDEFRNKDGLTWGTAVNLTNAVVGLQARMKDIQTPFFVAHGEKDSIVSIAASRKLEMEASTNDKSLHMYNDVLHLIREDSDEVNADFKNRIVQWIDSHIK